MADVHGAGAAAGSETADPALPVVVPVAPVVRPRRRLSARALGALAIGATAIGALAIGTLAIGLVALSFVAFTRRVAHAGSAYAYITHTFGSRAGFVAGWTLLLTYLGFATGFAGLVGSFGAAFLRQGVGKAVLHHLLTIARARGYARVSLETGRGDAFDPAIALYRKNGFVGCPAFADYVIDGFSQCMTRALTP